MMREIEKHYMGYMAFTGFPRYSGYVPQSVLLGRLVEQMQEPLFLALHHAEGLENTACGVWLFGRETAYFSCRKQSITPRPVRARDHPCRDGRVPSHRRHETGSLLPRRRAGRCGVIPSPAQPRRLARFVESRCWRHSCGPSSGFGLKSRLPVNWRTGWIGRIGRGRAFFREVPNCETSISIGLWLER